jgi:hypothetical protein
MVAQLRAALVACQGNDAASLESAISGLVAAVEDLNALGTTDTRAVHDAITRLLRECQRRSAALQE